MIYSQGKKKKKKCISILTSALKTTGKRGDLYLLRFACKKYLKVLDAGLTGNNDEFKTNQR